MTVDPNALATWANAVTVSRILVSPLMFTAIPSATGGRWTGSWWAVALWFVLCVSDSLDGYLARRHGTTRSGAFLDPLADKVLVLCAMFTLVNRGMFVLGLVLVIAARELIVSIYRVVVGSHGVSVPASRLAKVKTLSQQLSVGFVLLPWTASSTWLWDGLLWLAVALTVLSGAQYAVRALRPA